MLLSNKFLYQLIYTIYTINFTLTGGSDYKNPKLVISGYVDSNNKIVNSSQTYTSATSSIKVIQYLLPQNHIEHFICILEILNMNKACIENFLKQERFKLILHLKVLIKCHVKSEENL